MATAVWFKGVCDNVLSRLEAWHNNYEKGEVYASRPFLDHDFTQKDIPVLFAHDVPWRMDELEYLVRLLTAEKPAWSVTKDFTKILGIIKNRSLWKQYEQMIKLRGDVFTVTLVFEKPDLKEAVLTLRRVRDGRRGTNEELLAEKQRAGKDIWET